MRTEQEIRDKIILIEYNLEECKDNSLNEIMRSSIILLKWVLNAGKDK